METILLSVHVLLGAAVIGLVLVQQGKGADAGALFWRWSVSDSLWFSGFWKLPSKADGGTVCPIFHYESDIGCDCKAEGRRSRSFWSPDLPAQDVESVIQEPVAPKTVD